ncbi:galactose mutarotase-like [Rhynchophorus ferrugineus]|uniref:galactose mutarotase-like n=1 Tax=Rhynchophorus ferrugineus TaxID=354439 RepID=UPI003FCE8410
MSFESVSTSSVSRASVTLKIDGFGAYKNQKGETKAVTRFTWTNSNKVSVQIINYGATITSIKVPNKQGKIDDIVTGFDTIQEYLSSKNRYYGATIGRVANRTAKGKMTVEDVEYNLAINNGPNHLHGGLQGFDKVLWNYHISRSKVILTYHSADKEEGYPGDLLATIAFELTPDNDFIIDYKAVVSKPCPVNLTNHSYFNLAGHGTGAKELYKHQITINADAYTEVDETAIPTGNLIPVSETVFDLRVPKILGDVITKVPEAPGFDHNFCVTRISEKDVVFVAKAFHPPSGRVMEVYSNQPGVQFYTGNFMPEDESSQGKGATYKKHGAFCFETQIYPDAVNHEHFPKVILNPGEEYHHLTKFRFLVKN